MTNSALRLTGSRWFVVLAALASVACLAGPGHAQNALPPDIAVEIDRAAADVNRRASDDRKMVQRMRRLRIAPMSEPAGGQYAGHTMGAAVVGAIARHPNLTTAIVASAISALPEARNGIVNSATTAFPAFSAQIRAGASDSIQAPQPAPVRHVPATAQQQALPAPTQLAQPAPASRANSDETPEMETVGASDGAIEDPWEDFNRAVFEFNDVIDSYLLKPIAIAYGWLLPEPVKQSVRNGVANLMSPVILANDLLQFEFRDAAITTSRLIANSTMGIGGLFDVSSGMGLPPHPSDFGQTLHSYGMDSGPYLVLPLLGPSTVRDGFGQGVDTFLHPFTYVLSTPVNLGVTGGRAIVLRESLIEPLDNLRESSLDYYAALRSAYTQDRAVELRRGQPADSTRVDEMFDTFQ